MDSVYMPLQLAPSTLNQPILPNWSFNMVGVNLGSSANAALEQTILRNVGSYGRQLGHLAEVMEIVVRRLQLLEAKDLSQAERDIIQVFLGEVSRVRKLKGQGGEQDAAAEAEPLPQAQQLTKARRPSAAKA